METSATETEVKNANLGIGTPSKWYALTKHITMELFKIYLSKTVFEVFVNEL